MQTLLRSPQDTLKFQNAMRPCIKQYLIVDVYKRQGRGSASGSLVCYLLGITNIDPVRYNLLFERFLNPERVSMPDIDTDVKTSLRPLIIRYLKWRYGTRAVCSIATENTYKAKGALKAAGRDRASELCIHLPLSLIHICIVPSEQ